MENNYYLFLFLFLFIFIFIFIFIFGVYLLIIGKKTAGIRLIIINLLILLFNLINSRSFRKNKKADDILLDYKHISTQYDFVENISIGKSVKGLDINMLEISNNTNKNLPAVRIVANIHGNETSGIRIWLKLTKFICLTYQEFLNGETSDIHSRIGKLISSCKICIIPSMNPDNLFRSRYNENKKDLNRNFKLNNDHEFEPETVSIINNTNFYNYVLDMECHDGAQLLTFPHDRIRDGKTMDNENFEYICEEYLKLNPTFRNNPSPRKFKKCYTMGSLWYSIEGSLRDYMYLEKQILGITIEFSKKKQVNDKKIDELYLQHKQSLIRFLELSLNSFCGYVYDNKDNPISDATIKIKNIKRENITNYDGYFAIFVKPGRYNITVEKDGYLSFNTTIDTNALNEKIVLSLI